MSDMANDPWDFDAPTTRAPRQLETRQRSERAREWQPSTILPDPIPQDGYTFRWCRAESRNQSDHRTYQKRLREGWEPVRAEDHQELMTDIGLGATQKTGIVEVGGLILCKMPDEMVEQRRRYYAKLSRGQVEAAEDNYMRDPHEVAERLFKKRRENVFGQNPR
jgi:hypothetical protein